MDILHTIIIKVASVVTAMFLFLGNSPTPTPKVTIVEVQDNQVTVTEPTTTPQIAPKAPPVAIVPVQTTETAPTPTTPDVVPKIETKTVYVPVYIYQAPIPATTGSAPLPNNPPKIMDPEPTPEVPQAPAQILIKNPLPGKGFKEGREYRFRSEPIDESNEIHLGAILINPDGSVNNEAVMEVTASEESQNKSINGTGNVSSFGDPNNPKYYYPYRYAFTEPGPHKITFRALGVEASITIDNVVEDTRP